MSQCHYGCWFGRKCLGTPLEDVVTFLQEKAPGPKYETMTRDEIEAALELYNERFSDEYFAGPDHLKKEAI